MSGGGKFYQFEVLNIEADLWYHFVVLGPQKKKEKKKYLAKKKKKKKIKRIKGGGRCGGRR